MPKQKTRKSVAKRFKKTGSGKYKFKAAGRRHLAASKSSKQKRNMRRESVVSKADMNRVATQIAD